MRGLCGKVFLVTGAGRGIGEATARRLSAEGARVAIVDRDGDLAQEVATSLPNAIGIRSDVSSEADTRDCFARTIAHFGRLDGAHLNAGIGGAWGVGLAEMDDFDRVVAVNLRGVYLGLREALRYFRAAGHGGTIVTTSSTAGIVGGEWVSPYVGAKHGVVGLTKAAAVNGGPLGVRVNCVAPGLVVTRLTDINESVVEDAAKARLKQVETVPLGRAGSPEEVASVVAFLLSDDASYVSGVVIPVEGASLVDHPRARAIANLARDEKSSGLTRPEAKHVSA
jgi:NAD(P)-dependent dehydrogenase (short-subunit alcohol dehydrogenase family)